MCVWLDGLYGRAHTLRPCPHLHGLPEVLQRQLVEVLLHLHRPVRRRREYEPVGGLQLQSTLRARLQL